MKTLLIGIGNPGRGDDGLGPALVERLTGNRPPERTVLPAAGGSVDAYWTYQLSIEDASLLREYGRVVFADAAVDAAAPAELLPLAPAASIAFTSHEMSPASVLALAEELYGGSPAARLLRIGGAEWGFIERLSAEAGRHLDEAERLFWEFAGQARPVTR